MLSELRKATRSVAALLLWVASNALWPAPGSERESIWSVSKANARLFFNLTFVIWTGALTLLSLDEWAKAAAPVATLREAGYFAEIVLARFTAFGLGLTMLCILLTIVLAVVWRFLMALSDVINRKWVEPQKEKYFASRKDAWEKRMREEVQSQVREEVRKQVREEARNQAQDEASAAWRGWLNRRDAAAAKGDPFDEPAPDER